MATTNPYDQTNFTSPQPTSTFDQSTAPVASTAVAQQAKAATRDVDPNSLVQNQITSLLNGDNPYIKLAEQKAMEYANSRGVLNSSIAAGAGRQAAIESAMPIAQQDAGVFETASRDNQQYQNEMRQQNARLGTDVNMQNASEQNRLTGEYMQHQYNVSELGADYAGKAGLSAQEAAQTSALSAQEAGQAGALSAQEAGQTRALSYQESQQTLVRDYQNMLNELTVQAQQATDEQEKMRLDAALTRLQDEINFIQDLDMMDRESQLKIEFLMADASVRERLAEIEQSYAVELETLKSEYNLMENQQTVLGALYTDALKSIATILDDPDMSGTAASQRSNVIIQNLKSSLQFVTGMTGTPQALVSTYTGGTIGTAPTNGTAPAPTTTTTAPTPSQTQQTALNTLSSSYILDSQARRYYGETDNVIADADGSYSKPYTVPSSSVQTVISAGGVYVGTNLYKLPNNTFVQLYHLREEPTDYYNGGGG